jgi:hypothetical protein
VESDSAPTAGTVEQAEPEGKAPGPKPAMVKKPKAANPEAEAKASKAKAAKPAPKKPAAAKPAQHKPFFRKTAQDLARRNLLQKVPIFSQKLRVSKSYTRLYTVAD